MSFHPNEVQRRGRIASGLLFLTIVFLIGSFFRTQILQHSQWVLKSEGNRLREVPIPAQRGYIYDRTGAIIAENIPGYTISLLAQSSDELSAVLRRLAGTIIVTDEQADAVMRRYRRNPSRQSFF